MHFYFLKVPSILLSSYTVFSSPITYHYANVDSLRILSLAHLSHFVLLLLRPLLFSLLTLDEFISCLLILDFPPNLRPRNGTSLLVLSNILCAMTCFVILLNSRRRSLAGRHTTLLDVLRAFVTRLFGSIDTRYRCTFISQIERLHLVPIIGISPFA